MLIQVVNSTHQFRGTGKNRMQSGGGGGGLSWPNDPYTLGTSGWVLESDYDCSALDNTGASTGGWTNVYPSDLTGSPPNCEVITDATAPSTDQKVWRMYYKSGDTLRCGSSPATEHYDLATHYTQLYFAAYMKFTDPMPFPGHQSQSGEVHTLFANMDVGGVVLDLIGMVGGIEMAYDQFSHVGGLFTLGTWNRYEMLLNCNTDTATLWINNSKVQWDPGATDTTTTVAFGTDFRTLEVNGTWGGCTPPDNPDFDGYLSFDHVRVTGKV